MNRAAATLVVLAAVGGMVMLAARFRAPDGEIDPPVQFERKSRFVQDEVAECVGSGIGRAFADFEYVGAPKAPITYAYRAYMSTDGSKLSMDQVGAGTVLRFASTKGISGELQDLLEWCATTPALTWLPRSPR